MLHSCYYGLEKREEGDKSTLFSILKCSSRADAENSFKAEKNYGSMLASGRAFVVYDDNIQQLPVHSLPNGETHGIQPLNIFHFLLRYYK